MATKLNRARTEALLDALDAGATLEAAARAAGVHRSTVYRWLERGRQPGAKRYYRRFVWRWDARRGWGRWLR
jgi:transposase